MGTSTVHGQPGVSSFLSAHVCLAAPATSCHPFSNTQSRQESSLSLSPSTNLGDSRLGMLLMTLRLLTHKSLFLHYSLRSSEFNSPNSRQVLSLPICLASRHQPIPSLPGSLSHAN
ncbi:hypothetical protein KP509_08G065100 [Ceratopteris richardii]|uniref:Uncharacterized protein n=1 Tax=Ceratopteris richardii TaxID=49495 RepID=A0A8T2UH54_CERRI|nr:hypothetical protein KP509_08G065100 [Ceratopteris richardii]